MRYMLLNPGPVSLSDGVRKAAVKTDLCHREPEYFALQDRVRSGLLGVYDLEPECWSSVLLGGSGTTALEAMMSSLLPRDARLLVVENGVYGERISRIAEIHGIDFSVIRHEWTDPIDLERVADALSSSEFSHVAAVHHETTTGRLNDIAALAQLCERQGVQLLLTRCPVMERNTSRSSRRCLSPAQQRPTNACMASRVCVSWFAVNIPWPMLRNRPAACTCIFRFGRTSRTSRKHHLLLR